MKAAIEARKKQWKLDAAEMSQTEADDLAEQMALHAAAAQSIALQHAQGGVQIGCASLVDLQSGQVVWFNLLARPTGDLRETEPAKESIDVLLTGFPSPK